MGDRARKLDRVIEPQPLVRPLTKSRFKTACECPTKLFYINKDTYGDNKVDNPFLMALAAGGFQVGELAKLYFPGGTEVESKDYAISLEQTRELPQQSQVTIYEGAFRFGNLFVRADIVVKDGPTLYLYEVKAKSWSPSKDTFWLKDKKGLSTSHLSYLYDVAFQYHVISNAHTELHVIPHLYLANKDAVASVDGLNQKFILKQSSNGRHSVVRSPELDAKQLGTKLLDKVEVTEEVKTIIAGNDRDDSLENREGRAFGEWVEFLATQYLEDKKIPAVLSGECKACEYRTPKDDFPDKKSGFDECWTEAIMASEKDSERARVFDVWNFRKAKELMNDGVYFMDELSPDMVANKTKSKKKVPGLSNQERQWLQIEKTKTGDKTPFFDKKGFEAEANSWTYPLHFIDFETSMAAIPFNKGRRPYEQIAFQFSHHTVQKDGTIKHTGQWLNFERGKFPNFDFVRALKVELDKDDGTIFRYATHENTVLCQIYNQLLDSNEKDREELCAWIRTITYSSGGIKGEEWEGKRQMVDMLELVKRYYYDPYMEGSNSIKVVLPAVLGSSAFLKKKYSEPIYGAPKGIHSLNYKSKTWVESDKLGNIIDPYSSLPKIFENDELVQFENFIERFVKDDELRDGGAAMMAYAKMQFAEMSDVEREQVKAALLRYCELDTMAMVMLFEGWVNFK